jgi:nicotinate dehydrogenase subunit A
MAAIDLRVNGRAQTVDVDPATPLLHVLTDDLALRGPKFGCGLGQCGACTVIVDGQAVRSCVTPVSRVARRPITTLEGLGSPEAPHPLQQAFIDEQAAQCGFCLSGVILTAKALLDRNPRASDAQIRDALSTVLCRCFVHTRMLRAIARYSERLNAANGPAAFDSAQARGAGPRDTNASRGPGHAIEPLPDQAPLA